MSRVFNIKGPNLNNLMNKINSKNIDMIRGPLIKLSAKVKKDIRADSPVRSGEFKNSIRKKTTINKLKNIAFSKIGVRRGSKAVKYGRKVEKKYNEMQLAAVNTDKAG